MSPTTQSQIQPTRFAESDEEANYRYLTHKSVDPFPEIAPALLNSADLSDYAAKTALIFPFVDNDENLKAAAYRVRILGEIVYWEPGGFLKSRILGENDQFILAPNSITYITLEPVFRVPDYIKVWFNLDASHGYKGLFLNSGFIDPGWVGRLVVPLHNPTANEYPLMGRDSLIWITLMKISPRPQREQLALFKTLRIGKFREFPEHKKNPTIEDHLKEAVGSNGSVRTARAVILDNVTNSATPLAPEPARKVEASTKVAAENVAAMESVVKAYEQMATTTEAVLKAAAEIAAANEASIRTLTDAAAKIADAATALAEVANRNQANRQPSRTKLGEFILVATLVFAIFASTVTMMSLTLSVHQNGGKTENVRPDTPPSRNSFMPDDPTQPPDPKASGSQRRRPQKDRRASKRSTPPAIPAPEL